MADFDSSFDEIFKLEGVYSNDPDDRGGETRYGISTKFLKDNYPHLSISDITLDKAKELYKDYFWDHSRLGEIESNTIAFQIFEMCINLGRGTGIKIVQRALKIWYSEIEVDGVIGDKTIAAINKVRLKYGKGFINTINYYQVDRYLDMVRSDPSQSKFLYGWLNRV